MQRAAQAPTSLQVWLDVAAVRRGGATLAARQQALGLAAQQQAPQHAAQQHQAPEEQPHGAVLGASGGGSRVQRTLFPVLSAAAGS